MDENNAVMKALLASKVGSGPYQLQHMLDRSGQKISYKQVLSRFYKSSNNDDFIEDIEDLLINPGTSPAKISKEDYEIHILLSKPPGLLMVVQFVNNEKEEIKNLPTEKYPSNLDLPSYDTSKEPEDCRIFLGHSVCYENIEYPLVLLDALKETKRFGSNPDFSSQNGDDNAFDIFEKADRKYIKNLRTPEFTIEHSRAILSQPEKLTESARRDLRRFKSLQSILKDKFDKVKDEHNILRVFAATHSGLFFSYPHWNINPDYYACAEDFVRKAKLDSVFSETLFEGSIERVSRAFSDKGRKGIAIVIGIDVILSTQNLSRYSTTFSKMNNTQKLCEERTCDCEIHTSLQLPEKIESCMSIENELDCRQNIFCEFFGKCKIQRQFEYDKELFNSKCETVSMKVLKDCNFRIFSEFICILDYKFNSYNEFSHRCLFGKSAHKKKS